MFFQINITHECIQKNKANTTQIWNSKFEISFSEIQIGNSKFEIRFPVIQIGNSKFEGGFPVIQIGNSKFEGRFPMIQLGNSKLDCFQFWMIYYWFSMELVKNFMAMIQTKCRNQPNTKQCSISAELTYCTQWAGWDIVCHAYQKAWNHLDCWLTKSTSLQLLQMACVWIHADS